MDTNGPARGPRAHRARLGWEAGAAMAAAMLLWACASSQPGAEVASADQCIASCSKPSPNGESCFEWASLTSSACVARYSAVEQCCAPGDRPLCALSAPVPVGAACICRGADRHGPFVVQGSACRPD